MLLPQCTSQLIPIVSEAYPNSIVAIIVPILVIETTGLTALIGVAL
jgi:hypothetical protein